jgi:hypothetical protein
MQDNMERIKELAMSMHDLAEDAFDQAFSVSNEISCIELATLKDLAAEIVRLAEDALECPF